MRGDRAVAPRCVLALGRARRGGAARRRRAARRPARPRPPAWRRAGRRHLRARRSCCAIRPRRRRPGPTSAWRCGRSARRPTPAGPQRLTGRFQPAHRRLARAGDGELAGRRVLGDRRAAADRRAGADLDRRDQDAVAADVRVGADRRAVLVRAVVVGGDAAGAEVDALADVAVAEVGEVVGLGAVAERRVLDLDEVADVHVGAERRAAAQARERADDRRAGRRSRRALRRRCGCRAGSSRRRRCARCGSRSRRRCERRRRARPVPSKMQPTSISTSLPQTQLAAQVEAAPDRRGARRRPSAAPPRRAGSAARGRRAASALLTPSTSVSPLARDADDLDALGDRERDDVGQVVLAGGVVVAQAQRASA